MQASVIRLKLVAQPSLPLFISLTELLTPLTFSSINYLTMCRLDYFLSSVDQ